MQATPVSVEFTPATAAALMQIIEAGGKALGAQSWAAALEGMQAIHQGMQAAHAKDQERIAALAAAASKEPAP